jgi:putative transposase
MKELSAMPFKTGRPIHRRRSLRLREYDYSQSGAYFVTICTCNKDCLFGHVSAGEMMLNDAGRIVHTAWNELSIRFPGLELDAFTTMPNHIHGILVFVGAGLALPDKEGAASSAPTLGDVMRAFKSLSAIRVNRMAKRTGSLWQRNYYEHVIRNENDLDRLRRYIYDNPGQWAEDENNPEKKTVR